MGILGVGLIGVPVLAGSGAYALCEAMDWKWELERKATDARGLGAYTAHPAIVVLGWIATAIMAAAAVRMFIPG